MIRLSNETPTVLGVGYYGVGRFNSKSPEYAVWKNMLSRCYYDKNKQSYNPDAKVCDSWLQYQIFAEWCEQTRPSREHQLDKDLSGGTIYGPDTCIWLPAKINSLINIKRRKNSNLPVGVLQERGVQTYRVRCSNALGVQKDVGFFDSIEEAAVAYATYKESVVRELADEYFSKGLITARAKDLLYLFKIRNE